MAATAAMILCNTAPSFAQNQKTFTPALKAPQTSQEFKEDIEFGKKSSSATSDENYRYQNSASPRRLQQHGLGVGLGQTFLMGNYGKHGDDKITMDLFYSYAASYSFDLLINAHLSEHSDENEKMKLMGLTSSFKGRFVEYDNFSPFFLGGLGFYAPRAKRFNGTSSSWTKQDVTFGLNFGGGADLRLNSHYVVGLMGQMHWPFQVEQDGQSDLKGYYLKLLITGMYQF